MHTSPRARSHPCSCAASDLRCEPVGSAPRLHWASFLPARPVGALFSSRWSPRPPPCQQHVPAWGRGVGVPRPSRSFMGEGRSCGPRWSVLHLGRMCRAPKSGVRQAVTWKSVGRPHPAPSPALPYPAGAAPATDRLALFMDTRGGGRPDPPSRNTLTRGWGTSMLQSRHTTPALGPGRLGEGSWHSLAPGFGLKEKKGSWGRCGSALEGFGGGCPEALQRASIGGVEGSRRFPVRLKNT